MNTVVGSLPLGLVPFSSTRSCVSYPETPGGRDKGHGWRLQLWHRVVRFRRIPNERAVLRKVQSRLVCRTRAAFSYRRFRKAIRHRGCFVPGRASNRRLRARGSASFFFFFNRYWLLLLFPREAPSRRIGAWRAVNPLSFLFIYFFSRRQ